MEGMFLKESGGITACSTIRVTYSDQDGRGRSSDARSLMGGAYYKFHHTSEEAAMGQGQGSPVARQHNNNSVSNTHTLSHTHSHTFFLQKQ